MVLMECLHCAAKVGVCKACCVKLAAVQREDGDGKGTGLDGVSGTFQKSRVGRR